MQQEQLTQLVNLIAEYIVLFVITAVSVFVVPLLRDWLKRKNLYDYVVIAVKAAEQMFTHDMSKEKYDYVKAWIMQKFNITEQDLRALIESAVCEIKQTKELTEVTRDARKF